MILLEKNWKSLLLINLVHCSVPIQACNDLDLLITIEQANKSSKLASELNTYYLENFKQIKDMYVKLMSLKLDQYEMSSFKLIALLKSDSKMSLENEPLVKLMQTQLILQLKEYERLKQINSDASPLATSPSNKFDLILFYLNEINSRVNEKTFETVFFKHQIGELSMNEIVSGIFIR